MVGNREDDFQFPINNSTIMGIGGGAIVAGRVAAFLAASVLLLIARGAAVGCGS